MKKYILFLSFFGILLTNCAVKNNGSDPLSVEIQSSPEHPIDGKWNWVSSKVCSRLNPAPNTPASCNCEKILILQNGQARLYEDQKESWSAAFALEDTAEQMGDYFPLKLESPHLKGYIHLEKDELTITMCPVDGTEHKYERLK